MEFSDILFRLVFSRCNVHIWQGNSGVFREYATIAAKPTKSSCLTYEIVRLLLNVISSFRKSF